MTDLTSLPAEVPCAPAPRSDDDGLPDQNGSHRFGSLRPKQILAKMHHTRKYFDSGEFWCARQGVQLQDVLPGGAQVDTLPVKQHPSTVHGPRPTHMMVVVSGEAQPVTFMPDYSVVDY